MKLRYGIISEVDYQQGRARVNFDELDIVSSWLTLPKSKVTDNRYFAINMQVAVIMHENGEDGEILHEVPYDGNSAATWANDHTEGVQFKDGTKVTYNSTTKELAIDGGVNEIVFDCAKLTVKGTIEATGDVKAGEVSLQNHIHAATPQLVAGTTEVTGTITIAKP